MSNSSSKSISIIELCRELYFHKLLIISTSSLFFIIAVFISLNISNRYEAKVMLAGVVDDAGGLASLAKSFGGLASVAGLNLGGAGGEDKTDIALAILRSHKFINDFVSKYHLSVPLIASNDYNLETDKLSIDSSLYDIKLKKWVREAKFPKTIEPSPWEIHQEFLDLLTIEQDVKTGFVTISVEFYSPKLAKVWVENLVIEINKKISNDEKQKAKKSIVFLKKALDEISNASMQQTFYQLIEEQTKTLMLTESKSEYVFETLSPAYIPEKRSFPNRIIICISGGFLGAIIICFWVSARYFYRNESL